MTVKGIEGLDYSFQEPNFNLVKSKGYSFVLSYFSRDDKKDWQKDELDRALKAGLDVGAVYETYAARPKAGYEAGVFDANDAKAQAAQIGYTGSLYFAVDFGAVGAELDLVEQYFRGVNSILPVDQIGVYGSYFVVQRIADKGLAKWYWQTSAWSKNKYDERTHIYQNANIGSGIPGTDWNLGSPEMGLMKADGSVSIPTPNPVPPVPPAPTPTENMPAYPGLLVIGTKNKAGTKLFQRKLSDRGWRITVDEDFGPKTQNIVKAFQKQKANWIRANFPQAKKLTDAQIADGKVGLMTWTAIWKSPRT